MALNQHSVFIFFSFFYCSNFIVSSLINTFLFISPYFTNFFAFFSSHLHFVDSTIQRSTYILACNAVARAHTYTVIETYGSGEQHWKRC